MAKQVDRKYAFVSRSDVVPGYLYDKASHEYYSRNDGLKIGTVITSPYIRITLWDFPMIDNCVKSTRVSRSTWQEDFLKENSEDVILVRGSKIQEEQGIDPPLDKCKHTVTSILYKSSQDMLLFFSKKLTGSSVTKLEAYFHSVLAAETESFIPQEVGKYFLKACIYQLYNQPGKKVTHFKHACAQFCLTLGDSKVSTIPMEAVIENPQPDPLDAVRNAKKIGTESTATVVSNSDYQNPMDSKNSTHSPVKHLEIADTHLPCECAMEESGLNSNENENENLQPLGSAQDSKTRKQIGWMTGPESSCRGRGNLKDGHVQYQAQAGRGRGYGTRMGRGKPSADDLLSVGRGTQKSCIENNVNSTLFPLTHQPGSQRTSDFMRKSTHQSSQNSHVQKVQNQTNASRVQQLAQTFEGYGDHRNKTDQTALQPQFLNDAERQDKPLGDNQSSVSSSISTLARDAQTTRMVTTVSITLNSKETNLDPHETSQCKTKAVSCTHEHIPHNGHSCETSNNEKNEGLEKTKCKVRDHSSQGANFDEIDKLIEQNLRDCSSTEANAHQGEDQAIAHQTKTDKSTQMVSNQETKHMKVSELDSQTAKADKTKKGVCHESPVENEKESDKASSNCALKRPCSNLETVLPNKNESKSDVKKSNNLKKPKISEVSSASYSSVGSKNDHVSRSGNIKAKQSKLLQGLDNDEEMLDLKSPKNASHTKQNLRPQKNRNMKTKLLTPVKVTKDPCGLERKYFGIVNECVPEKVLVLLGASGSGKTTLLNFIANYFRENKNADDDLIHVECTSQTLGITAYTFCTSLEDFPITVIDTPGLNDSSGGEVRDHVQALKTFFANAASKNVDVHALGFVAQAHLVRLTSSERLVMDYVSTMFGQNVSEHLITLVTFADNQDTPPVIEAMKNYKVKSKLFLKFNNSALSNGKTDEVDDLDRVYYRVCWRNWKKCLKTLKDSPPLSVNVMKAVQSEIYNTTVIESAEKDLKAEIATFFTSYEKEKTLSKEKLQVCEHIWSLAAVVQRVKGAQMSSSRTIEDILTNCAKEVCKDLQISTESFVHTLALAPSKALTIVGTEIIQCMTHAYKIMRGIESKGPSKYLIDMSYCHGCSKKKEHNMKRTELNWVKKTVAVGPEIVCFKCEDCKCPGNVHGEQPTQPAHQANEILQLTMSRLRKALQSYSLSGFAVSEQIFLNHLREHLAFENQDFVDALVKMMSK